MPEDFADDDSSKASGAAAVGSTRHLSHLAADDEALDETSRTHHEPNVMKESIESIVEEGLSGDGGGQLQKEQNDGVGKPSGSSSPNEPADVNLRLHRKVAEIAANAYKHASAQSQVRMRRGRGSAIS